MIFDNREFQISVRQDGSSEWLELVALNKAGGDQRIADFIGSLMGESDAANRLRHLTEEFTIITSKDDTILPLMKYAAEQPDTYPMVEGLEDSLDEYFTSLFKTEVNPQLPNSIEFA
jgi:hypothetical protein